MSDTPRFARRALFDVFRRTAEAPPPEKCAAERPFSLDAFYAHRPEGQPSTTVPRFLHRQGLPVVETVAAYAEPVGPEETAEASASTPRISRG